MACKCASFSVIPSTATHTAKAVSRYNSLRVETTSLSAFAHLNSNQSSKPRSILKVFASRKDASNTVRANASSATTDAPTSLTIDAPSSLTIDEIDSRIIQVHTQGELDAALEDAKDKLVVVEFAASHSKNSAKIYPAMVNISRQSPVVKILQVMGDESEDTKKICTDACITTVPHFIFYKHGVKVHEEQGVDPDQLYSDVLYYINTESPVKQLHSKEELLGLIKEHMEDHKLVVIDMSLNYCGPCAKVYPTVMKLSHQMKDSVVFGRMIGDENDSCREMMKAFKIVEVPTFLFLRDGKLQGRYVGSGRGELIGEVLRYQGVKCT